MHYTYNEILEVSTKNNIGLAAYILTYGGDYHQDDINKMAAIISEANLQAIIDQYMKFSDDYSTRSQTEDAFWMQHYQNLSLAMAARAAKWAIAKPLEEKRTHEKQKPGT